MKKVIVIDRTTGRKEEEKIMGHSMIMLFYGQSVFTKLFAPILHLLFCHFHGVSKFYGWMQKLSSSKKNIVPFIKKYRVNTQEFEKPVIAFTSFNDFFTRTLRQDARPVDPHPASAVCPADGRYLCFQNIQDIKNFWIKGQKFTLQEFLKDTKLAKKFQDGSMVIARLCPSDYHRFHFPVSGKAFKARQIQGALFSVNPIALFKNFLILQENKRSITLIDSDHFGEVAYVEIGATNVGTIIQTYNPSSFVKKGDEKGYFSFGGSCVVLLFEKGKITLDTDLVENTRKGFETKTEMGLSLGKAKH